jgi:endo-1,4-beta-xylanase
MDKARTSMSQVGKVALAVILGSWLPACLRPPAQKSPAAANLAAAPVPAPAPAPAPEAAPAPSVVSVSIPGMPASLAWTTTGPIIAPISDPKHDLVAIKDPTIVRYKDRWHVYASSVGRGGIYGMVYLSFADWADASKASIYYMDKTPGFDTYVAAPQLFYFTPKKEWYLVFQSGPPMFSTNNDPSDPTKWSLPQPFYPKTPAVIDQNGGWLDFWVICDTQFCHLFFSNDHGRWYKSKTSIDKFPRGFGEPVVVLQDEEAGRVFEACNVYKINGTNKYLALIEAFDKTSSFRRYFRSWIADSLEGPWTAVHEYGTAPFAGKQNVISDGEPWCDDISHGELIRAGYDETLAVDLSQPKLLYQAFERGKNNKDYNSIPWRLGLLTRK